MNPLLKAAAATLLMATGMPALRAAVRPDTLQPVYYYYRDTFCSDQLVFVGSMLYSPQQPAGTEVLTGAAANGADSIIVVDLSFRQPVEVDYNPVLCEADTIWVNGSPYHAAHWFGDEVVIAGAANGCDSIIHVEIVLEAAPYRYLRDTLCPGAFYEINGRRYDTNNRSGLEILPNAAASGCDSLVFVELAFRDSWIYLGEDRTITIGDTACLAVLYGSSPQTLAWFPEPPCDGPGCSVGCVRLIDSREYRVEMVDVNGCVLADTVRIRVTDDNRVFAPTAMDPEADKFENRFFYLSGDYGVVNIRRLVVADRWGGIVFEGRDIPPGDPAYGWDGRFRGKIVEPGVYTFWAELERLDESTFLKSGTVAVMR